MRYQKWRFSLFSLILYLFLFLYTFQNVFLSVKYNCYPVNTVTGPDRIKSGFFSPRPDRTIFVRSPVSRPDRTKFYGPVRSGTVDNYGNYPRSAKKWSNSQKSVPILRFGVTSRIFGKSWQLNKTNFIDFDFFIELIILIWAFWRVFVWFWRIIFSLRKVGFKNDFTQAQFMRFS